VLDKAVKTKDEEIATLRAQLKKAQAQVWVIGFRV